MKPFILTISTEFHLENSNRMGTPKSLEPPNTVLIDKNTGTIQLTSGLVITTELNKAGIENSVYFGQATPYDYGTLPFRWYRFNGGQLDRHGLNVNICFYADVLVDFSICADFYQSLPRKWENISLEVESQSKAFHDQLLQNELGKPHKTVSLPLGQNQPILDYRIEYSYKWGSVSSAYDSRAGSSSISIRYGSRLKDAQNDYRKKKV